MNKNNLRAHERQAQPTRAAAFGIAGAVCLVASVAIFTATTSSTSSAEVPEPTTPTVAIEPSTPATPGSAPESEPIQPSAEPVQIPVSGNTPAPHVGSEPAPIQEDDPNWDCRFDGNERCGVEIHGVWYIIQFRDGSPESVGYRGTGE